MNTTTKLFPAVMARIAAEAATMGTYHGEHFADSVRIELAGSAASADEEEALAFVSLFAADYRAGVQEERERILSIDKVAESLGPAYTKEVRAAKMDCACTAGDLATKIIASHSGIVCSAPLLPQ